MKRGPKRGRSNGKWWTRGELAILREGWAEYSWRELLRRLKGRSVHAIQNRAWLLGLGRRFQGFISVKKAIAMTVLDRHVFHRMVRVEGLGVFNVTVTGHHRRLVVEEERLLEAAAQFVRRETITQAAERLGVTRRILGMAVRASGAKTAGKHRGFFLPEEYDGFLVSWRRHVATNRRQQAEQLCLRNKKGRT